MRRKLRKMSVPILNGLAVLAGKKRCSGPLKPLEHWEFLALARKPQKCGEIAA